MCHLYSVSLSKQCIPNEWKCHSITPIYKSGDKSNVINYRPISLLCIVSKVLEHRVYNKVSAFIVNNNILCHHQFGFRRHHFTTQQLLIFLSNVHRALNNCHQCDVIYLDLKNASHIKNYCWSCGRLVLWEACGDGSVNTSPTDTKTCVLTAATLQCYQ